MKKILITALAVAALITSVFAPIATVMASEINVNTVNPITTEITPTDTPVPTATVTPTLDPGLGDVTLGDVSDKIVGKVNEVVILVQKVLGPVTIICFMLSAIFTITGALSKKGSWMSGALGMIISGVVYACITYADVIVNLISNWVVS